MLNILLMMPPMSITDNYLNMEAAAANMPSMGMAYIYSALE